MEFKSQSGHLQEIAAANSGIKVYEKKMEQEVGRVNLDALNTTRLHLKTSNILNILAINKTLSSLMMEHSRCKNTIKITLHA